ncbi:MAG: hypothetical protein ACKO9I_21490 [Sphaerospermopsis kisseleviana]|jgi:hypothetical protein|uniref:Cell division protein FtsL n=2 Tax=Sphaerospermopsis TaxID=752201 RepID=A0A480A8G5_9CYAN|nr:MULTISPECIES: hypothetical protein [Sphaerospermopsis]BAZ82909.1 hypothetical protein NIES73_41920 [Sphaerospermopsis kisseleviana NIES-73]MBD2132353.1 hypothetical protein [Sphaerospermopsis sp. FACHB-1094]MBD2146365.1 hypothetical protein [Sphaerospermopsis sp. FACHB-1194]MDB9440750.1 hypothetical protein [Sphaerospermopsis kisseleviana CS-549]GCL39431.1 hypothetical protein SR1949_45570 [Sphaerospermopsis reniformis]
MNAFQPSKPPLQPPVKPTRTAPRPKKHLHQRSYQIMALETSAKITVNLVIITAAVSALSQLMPYHRLQQDKLREIRTEVKLMQGRVDDLRTEFSRNFDPSQANSIRQEQSYRFAPSQLPVVLINPDTKDTERSNSTP